MNREKAIQMQEAVDALLLDPEIQAATEKMVERMTQAILENMLFGVPLPPSPEGG